MTKDTAQPPLATLLERLDKAEGEPSRDEILSFFLEYVAGLGLELYPAQEEAVLELLDWKHVVLSTPTGSGKSLVAMALHFQAMVEGRISYYTCPIKALVNEKFFDLCDAFGPENVGLLTGDAAVNTDAPIICCTAEILANKALADPNLPVDYVVMDEFHFYGDPERGAAWHIPLITMRDTMFLMMSATLGDTSHITAELEKFTDRAVTVVQGTQRPVPLRFEYREIDLQETVQELIDSDEAPIYLVNFTQRACAEVAQALTSIKVVGKEEKAQIGRFLSEYRLDTPYGKELSRFLRAGIGVHHAGLLPKYRLIVEKLAQSGLLKVVSGTDSLGVGVNIPIRTVVFRALSKYDGQKTRLLSARQFHQIAGRAGRRGFDDHGNVVVLAPEHTIENKKVEAKLAVNPHLKKKLRKKSPPPGFVSWDKNEFERLVSSPPEPLEPQLEVSHAMLIGAMRAQQTLAGDGYRRIVEIIRNAHISPAKKLRQYKRAAELMRSLRKAEIVDLVPAENAKGKRFRVREDLQDNFSLNQALSVYLVEALELLDPDTQTYALDVLTFVESVLEDPKVILLRQKDRIKDELIGRLKAEGVEYEKRMEALDEVEHPKPNEELIYESFNAFAEHHPWVRDENIRPKSVAREMFEKAIGFNDYVRFLGAARSEGVLLRYLSGAYKTALQNVPESCWNEEFEDIISFFSMLIRRVDSSLIDEWERMMHGEILTRRDLEDALPRAKRPTRPDDDFKAFSARLRNELYVLIRALAAKDYESAVEHVRQSDANPWNEPRFEEAMAPYFAEYESIDITPRARQPILTTIKKDDKHRYEVSHRIVDPEGHEEWGIEGIVDLFEPPEDPNAPLIELRHIGV